MVKYRLLCHFRRKDTQTEYVIRSYSPKMCTLHYAKSIWQNQDELYTKSDEIYPNIESIHKSTILFHAYFSRCISFTYTYTFPYTFIADNSIGRSYPENIGSLNKVNL